MSPITRTLALTAAALAIPAAIAAAAGPERVRRLPGQVRDLMQDDSVEGQLRRLTARLDELGDDLHIHSSRSDGLSQAARIAAAAGALLLVPTALAAWIGPKRIAETARRYRDEFTADRGGMFERDFADDLDDLEDDIARQREDAFDAVATRAQELRD